MAKVFVGGCSAAAVADEEIINCPVCSPEHLAAMGLPSTVSGLEMAGNFDAMNPKRVCLSCRRCIDVIKKDSINERFMQGLREKSNSSHTVICQISA